MTKSRGIQLNRPSPGTYTGLSCKIDNCMQKIKAFGFCRKHYLQNYRTGSPDRIISDDGWTNDRGYSIRRVNGKAIFDHVLLAEKALGRPPPKGAVVHHYGEDPFDNLKIMILPSQGFHKYLHQRQSAIEACGNPEWLKCVRCKRYDSPERVGIFSGNAKYHRNKSVCKGG